jgi:hypothetical protein
MVFVSHVSCNGITLLKYYLDLFVELPKQPFYCHTFLPVESTVLLCCETMDLTSYKLSKLVIYGRIPCCAFAMMSRHNSSMDCYCSYS